MIRILEDQDSNISTDVLSKIMENLIESSKDDKSIRNVHMLDMDETPDYCPTIALDYDRYRVNISIFNDSIKIEAPEVIYNTIKDYISRDLDILFLQEDDDAINDRDL